MRALLSSNRQARTLPLRTRDRNSLYSNCRQVRAGQNVQGGWLGGCSGQGVRLVCGWRCMHVAGNATLEAVGIAVNVSCKGPPQQGQSGGAGLFSSQLTGS
jgi:hypothetical protein